MATINNRQDIIDSRNVIERLEELQGERELLADELSEAEVCVKYHHPDGVDFGKEVQSTEVVEFRRCRDELAAWDEENAEELSALTAFADQLKDYGDWEHGESIIRESYFTEYAEELARDLGVVKESADWPNNHIDWDAAANELKIDYTEASLGGVTYLMRC